MGVHKKLHLLALGVSAVLYVVWMILASTSSSGKAPFREGSPLHGLDYNSTKLTPALWCSALLWAVTLFYLLVAFCYAFSTVFRKTPRHSYLYCDPPVIPLWTWVSASVSFVLCIIWMYVASEPRIWQSLLLLFLATLASYAAFTFTSVALLKYHDRMNAIGRWTDIGLTGACVHNALVFNTTWLWVVTLVHFAATMTYTWGVAMDTACIVALVIQLLDLLAISYVDNWLWFYRRKYIFTHYFVLIIAYIGMLTNYHEGGNGVTIFTYVMLFLTAASLAGKAARTHIKVNAESPREAAKRRSKLEKKLRERGVLHGAALGVATSPPVHVSAGNVGGGVVFASNPTVGPRNIHAFHVPQATLSPAPASFPMSVAPGTLPASIHMAAAPSPQPLLVSNHYHQPQQSPAVCSHALPPQMANVYLPNTILR